MQYIEQVTHRKCHKALSKFRGPIAPSFLSNPEDCLQELPACDDCIIQ